MCRYRVLCREADGDESSCVSLTTMHQSEGMPYRCDDGVHVVEERATWEIMGDQFNDWPRLPSMLVIVGMVAIVIRSNHQDREGHQQVAPPLVRGMSLAVESKLIAEPGASGQKFSVVIDGTSLPTILRSSRSVNRLRSIISHELCESAVFCRVNPKQKGDIVRLFKDGFRGRGRVLAIGDGANDINMIHQAHVGVGIFGQEGYQAAGTADYAISRFGDLYRLMFYHGRWNYERITHYINFFIYKNFLFTLCQFHFGTASRWSGQTVYDSFYVLVYNSIFSVLPLTVAALFDHDVHPDLDGPDGDGRIHHAPSVTPAFWRYQIIPKLYHRSAANYNFNPRVLSEWIVVGTLQSIVCYFGVWGLRQYNSASVGDHGLTSDLWMDSILLYTAVLALVSVLILLYTREWSWVLISAMVFFQILLYIAFVFAYDSAIDDDDASGYLYSALSSVSFWLILLLTVVVCFLPALALRKLKLLSSQVPLVEAIRQLRVSQ